VCLDTSIQEDFSDNNRQDKSLASVFSSRSLTEITDGEGTTSITNFIFSKGIIDNDSVYDALPKSSFLNGATMIQQQFGRL
jgi:hypothetical protein